VERIGQRLPSAALPEQGEFTFGATLPLRYAPQFRSLPANCYLKTMLYDGQPVPASGFRAKPGATLELTISAQRAARLNGTVLDGAGKPARYAVVVAMPSSPLPAAAVRDVLGDKDGNFTFEALAPGTYRVAAWQESMDWPLLQAADARLLQLFMSKARTVRLAARSTRAVHLDWITAEEAGAAAAGQ